MSRWFGFVMVLPALMIAAYLVDEHMGHPGHARPPPVSENTDAGSDYAWRLGSDNFASEPELRAHMPVHPASVDEAAHWFLQRKRAAGHTLDRADLVDFALHWHQERRPE